MSTRNLLVLVVAVFGATLLDAHEFWLGASTWRAVPGSTVTITANVGDRFPTPTTFTTPERVDRVRLIGPAGEVELKAPTLRREQDSLAVDLQIPPTPGTYVAVITVKPRLIEIGPSAFESYLSHEGLGRVVDERRRRGESDKPGRERYSRYAKVLFQAGAQGSSQVTRPVGLPIEIVPSVDPTGLRIGDALMVRLLADGRPVEGALVSAIYAASAGKPDEWPVGVRTDARGEARIPLEHAGPWLVRSVHMVRRGNESGPEAADWESYWAALTFNIGGR